MKQETKDTLRNVALSGVAVGLGTVGVVFAPGGTKGQILTAWTFVIGTFFGAMIRGFMKK